MLNLTVNDNYLMANRKNTLKISMIRSNLNEISEVLADQTEGDLGEDYLKSNSILNKRDT